jgi:hypothetical protein
MMGRKITLNRNHPPEKRWARAYPYSVLRPSGKKLGRNWRRAQTRLWIQQGLTDTSRTARNPGDGFIRWQSAFSTIFSV